MKKMTTFVCVAAITASLLAGCGGKQTETTAAAESTAASTEAAVSTETEAESAEGTDADKEAADKVAALIDAIYVQETVQGSKSRMGCSDRCSEGHG